MRSVNPVIGNLIVASVASAMLIGGLSGCGSDSAGTGNGGGPPSRGADFKGEILSIGNGMIVMTAPSSACDRATVRVSSKTSVLRRLDDGDYEKASLDDLEAGSGIEVWVGQQDDSCPPEAFGSTVVIA
jgi:hypothetical protein